MYLQNWIPPWEKENHLQTYLGWGYVSSQEGKSKTNVDEYSNFYGHSGFQLLTFRRNCDQKLILVFFVGGYNPFPKHFKDTIFTTISSQPKLRWGLEPPGPGPPDPVDAAAVSTGPPAPAPLTGPGTGQRGGTQETQQRRPVGRIHTKKHEKHQQLDEIWTKHEG